MFHIVYRILISLRLLIFLFFYFQYQYRNIILIESEITDGAMYRQNSSIHDVFIFK